jgi:ribonuclease III
MKRRSITDGALEARLGHVFTDKTVLERALTHISAAKTREGRLGSYQRLEFLGDHVLGLAISDMLVEAYPQADEGELSRRLAELVRAEACAEVADAMDLGSFVRLGPGEASAGGRRNATILSDACEAVIGATYLDGGWPAARSLVERFWRERMLAPIRPLRDSKSALQEWAARRGLPVPIYREIERSGPDHRPRFRVGVIVSGVAEAEGEGGSKRAAEQAAAETLLAREGVTVDA